MQFTFILAKIISLFSIIQKYFFKSLFEKNVIKFRVNLKILQMRRDLNEQKMKRLYFCESLKVKILMKNLIKTTTFLNSKAEINVMTQRFMRTANLSMKVKSRLRLISHIEHEMNFVEMYKNVIINIEEFVIYHHIFVMTHANHQFVLRQFFLIDVNINYDYRFNEIYVIIFNSKITRSALFKCLNKQDSSNRIKEDLFSEFLN